KAMDALAPALKRDYPQLKICWLGDALWACGRALAIARANRWAFVFTFKEGRLPGLWRAFQALLRLGARAGGAGGRPGGGPAGVPLGQPPGLRGQRAAALDVERPAVPGDAAGRGAEAVRLGDGAAAVAADGGGGGDQGGAAALEDRERGVQPAEEQRHAVGA